MPSPIMEKLETFKTYTPPKDYTNFKLPALQLSHHPASSNEVTPVIIVKLHRPEARHAFTQQMADSLVEAFNTISADPRVKSVVLTSSDETNTVFCAGMDLSEGGVPSPSAETHRDEGGQVALAIYKCSKPVVVAINGHAVGVGITMTLPANVRVASKDAKVGFVFGRRGFCMEACSSFFLPRLVGTSKALHLTTTGAVYPASHRLYDSLFSEVVERDQVLPAALAIAEDIAKNQSGMAARVMKDLIYRGPQSPEEAHLLESKLFHVMIQDVDAREGISSFLEKRTPDFKGSAEGIPYYPWWTPLDVRAPARPKM